MAPTPLLNVTEHLDVHHHEQSEGKVSKLTVLSVSKLATKPEGTEYWFKTRNVHLYSNRLSEDAQPQKAPRLHPAVLKVTSLQLDEKTKNSLIQDFAPVRNCGVIDHPVVDAFFDNLTVVEPTRTRSQKGFEDVVKIDPQILFETIHLWSGTMNRLADQVGRTTAKGPRTTSETEAQEAYAQLLARTNSLGQVQMMLPKHLAFRVGHVNEATVRLPPDCFLQKVLNAIKEDRDMLHVEYTMKVPTYHKPLPEEPVNLGLEPATLRLDAGLSIHIKGLDPAMGAPVNLGAKSRNIVQILCTQENRTIYMDFYRHMANPSAAALVTAKDLATSKSFPYEGARIWTGTDFFFLVIEYKKKAMVSAVRQLAMQMTSVLIFNAGLTLSGVEWPIFGFLVEDATVEVYQGWLEKVSNPDLPDKVYIEQVHARRAGVSEVLVFNLGTSNGAIEFYRTLTSIRVYGCSTFAERAKEAVEEAYRLMAIPSKLPSLTKGYNAEYAAMRAAKTRNQGGQDLEDD